MYFMYPNHNYKILQPGHKLVTSKYYTDGTVALQQLFEKQSATGAGKLPQVIFACMCAEQCLIASMASCNKQKNYCNIQGFLNDRPYGDRWQTKKIEKCRLMRQQQPTEAAVVVASATANTSHRPDHHYRQLNQGRGQYS